MQIPFMSHGNSTPTSADEARDPATLAAASLAEKTAALAPLLQRREGLAASLAQLDGDIARLTSDRAQQLLAGEAVNTASAELRRLGDDRTSTVDAIAILDPQIRAIESQRSELRARIQQLENEARYSEAVKRAVAAREAARIELRTFVLERFPALIRELSASDAAAQQAAAAAGGSWVFGELWPTPAVANVAQSLEQASRMDVHVFGPA